VDRYAESVPVPKTTMSRADHYTPQNVLITGGAGFIASHVIALFVKKYPNYKVLLTIVNPGFLSLRFQLAMRRTTFALRCVSTFIHIFLGTSYGPCTRL